MIEAATTEMMSAFEGAESLEGLGLIWKERGGIPRQENGVAAALEARQVAELDRRLFSAREE